MAASPLLFGPADLGVPTDGWICLHCRTVWPADVFPCPIDGKRGWKATGPLYGSAIGATQYGPAPGREYQWAPLPVPRDSDIELTQE